MSHILWEREWVALIGRYQPFHDGHEALARRILDEGKSVCFMIRKMPESEHDPYNWMEIRKMILERFSNEWDSGQIEIVLIPNIVEVAYGRTPGWKVREIKLDEETEKISATEIRKELNKNE